MHGMAPSRKNKTFGVTLNQIFFFTYNITLMHKTNIDYLIRIVGQKQEERKNPKQLFSSFS